MVQASFFFFSYFRSLQSLLPRESAQNTRGFLVFTHVEWQQDFSFVTATLCRAIAKNNYQVKQTLYPQ